MAAAVGVGLVGQVFVAPAAQAGTLALTAEIQGAGSVHSAANDEGYAEGEQYSCSSPTGQQDDRVVSSCQRKTFEAAFEAWIWLKAIPASGPVSGNWTFAGWSGCDETRTTWSGEVQCGVHSGAFSLDEKRPRAIFEDVQTPSLTGPNASQSTTSERTFSFTFSSTDSTARFACRLDSEPYAPCSSGITKTMSEGSHTFQVYAHDPSGNRSATASLPVTAVDTAITGGPAGLTNSRTATFTYSSTAGNSFECSLDFGAWVACGTGNSGSKTYSALADGPHQVKVRAKNGGWTDQIPATRSWTIDATPPATSLDTKNVDGRDASFGFSAVEASGFQCQLSGPASAHGWQSCAAPRSYAGLADGDYTFEVRAVDSAGNIDPSPAAYSWEVDRTAPETSFGQAPVDGSWVLSRSVSLGLSSSESGSTFACSVDGAVRTCGPTSLALTDLPSGTHVATAAATDAAGNSDPTPAVRTWTVPFDDRQLSRLKGTWAQKSARAAYVGTYSVTTQKGAALTMKVAGVTRLALVATKAPGHGTVKVLLGRTLLNKISLASATVKNKQVVPVATFPTAKTGTVKIVVTTAGKQVRIDGLGFATG